MSKKRSNNKNDGGKKVTSMTNGDSDDEYASYPSKSLVESSTISSANFSVLAGDNDDTLPKTRKSRKKTMSNGKKSSLSSASSNSLTESSSNASPSNTLSRFLFGIFPMVEYEKRITGWKRRLFAKVFLGPLIGVILTLAFLYHSVDPRQLEFYRFIQESTFQLPDSIWNLPPFLQFDTFSPFMNRDAINNIIGFLNKMAQFEKSEQDHLHATEKDGPGEEYRKKGAVAHHPVVIIPGIVSTGLELWKGKSCSDGYFRKRIWGSLNMLRMLFLDKNCWLEHIKLNQTTGLDPEGIKLRAAQGLEAADFFMPGYWVWGKIIENLSPLGYDHSNLILASYDWRLGFHALEERDHYFSNLKRHVEHLYHNNNIRKDSIKVVLIAHSMGSLVVLYFFKWIEKFHGSQWIDKHIHAFLNIGGPLLGLPRSFSSYFSGEFKETAHLGEMESYLLELLFSKKERAEMFQSWPSSFSMTPKGGNQIWGDASRNAIDNQDGSKKHNSVINVKSPGSKSTNLTVDEALDLLLAIIGPKEAELIKKTYSFGYRPPPSSSFISESIANFVSSSSPLLSPSSKYDSDPKYWSNPLEASLPYAPNMKIYCMYGVGKQTERAFVYSAPENLDIKKLNRSDFSKSPQALIYLNTSANEPKDNLINGIYYSDGDGTVHLLSSGLMCIHGWRQSYLNPSGIKVITREYKHQPVSSITELRGGPLSSEHVDILGNEPVLSDIIEIVSRRKQTDERESTIAEPWSPISDNIISDIKSWILPDGWK